MGAVRCDGWNKVREVEVRSVAVVVVVEAVVVVEVV